MSRKHFKAFAEAIASVDIDKNERATLVNLIGKVCADENKNFDWMKFGEACEFREVDKDENNNNKV